MCYYPLPMPMTPDQQPEAPNTLEAQRNRILEALERAVSNPDYVSYFGWTCPQAKRANCESQLQQLRSVP